VKLSVAITTYNHAPYIAEALDSVLMQETDFNYEILIGEDGSTDGTREIVQKYKERYPDKIRLFLNDRENVICIHGRPTGRWNFVNNLTHARGKYIALLEGDDYWTDPCKLQQQVELLEAHPDCAICFHNMQVIYGDGKKESHPSNTNQKEISTIESLFGGNYIYTASCVFRNGLLGELPEWFMQVLPGDLPLFIMLAQYGKIKYLDKIMGVYRIHTSGIWGTKSKFFRLFCTADMFEKLFLNFQKSPYATPLGQAAFNQYYSLVSLLDRENDLKNARKHAVKLFSLRHYNPHRSKKGLYELLVRVYAPCFFKIASFIIKKIKS